MPSRGAGRRSHGATERETVGRSLGGDRMCGRNDQLGKRGGPLATRDERRARGLDGRGGKQGPIVADAPEDLLDPQLLSKPDERWLALPRLAEKHLDVDGQTIGDLLDDILLGHVPESDLEQGDLREHEAKDILVVRI
ncbi:unnamed protein product, partial [Tilletia controversa]